MNRASHPRVIALGLALALGACAVNMGGGKDIPASTVALRVAPGASSSAVAGALIDAGADVAFIAGRVDSAWLAAVATAVDLELSGPAADGDLALAFLAGEPLGDTTLVLPYAGGRLTVHDALYEVDDERYLDLMAFQIEEAAMARAAIGSLLRYMATDVMNAAAVIIAVAVPSPEVGDAVGRMLSPAYFDASRCESGLMPNPGEGIRMFYGPEARVYCESAGVESTGIGATVRARLVLGRR